MVLCLKVFKIWLSSLGFFVCVSIFKFFKMCGFNVGVLLLIVVRMLLLEFVSVFVVLFVVEIKFIWFFGSYWCRMVMSFL